MSNTEPAPTNPLMARIAQERAAIAAKNAKRGGLRIPFWRLDKKDRKATLRLLPTWAAPGEPFSDQFWRKMTQHWGVGGEAVPITCPRGSEGVEAGVACPVCEVLSQLRAKKTDLDAQQIAKDLRSKECYFLPIINLKDPVITAADIGDNKESDLKVGDPKIQVYAAPPTVFDDIISQMGTNELDITNLEAGNDIVIERMEKGGGDKYVSYKVVVLIKPTKAPVKDPKTFQTPSMLLVAPMKPYAEIKAMLADGPAGDYAALTSGKKTESLPESGSTEEGSYLEGDKSSESSSLADEMKKELGLG